MSATVVNECPICMDPIETQKNCVTTECGHCFHTNCLMTSVAHNGFGCPYCRTKMAEEVADEDSEYDDDEEEIYEQYDDYVLRGLRLFNNNINGEEHDQEDLDEEDEEASESEQEEEVAEEAEEATPPPVSYVAQKLVEQGITMEDLLKAVLCSVNNYERDYEDFERVENEIFGRVSTILNNYTPPAV
jgi:hypothetical protein